VPVNSNKMHLPQNTYTAKPGFQIRPFCVATDTPFFYKCMNTINELDIDVLYAFFKDSFICLDNDTAVCLADIFDVSHYVQYMNYTTGPGDYSIVLLPDPGLPLHGFKNVLLEIKKFCFLSGDAKRLLLSVDSWDEKTRVIVEQAGFKLIHTLKPIVPVANLYIYERD